ncbi:hypothetical protein CBF29_01035 [Vagococcus elongatus]|uniref:Uncharacterized protein n=1 Tax=Vagococcus elongatus TaxID=180344 RepID=A0A430B5V2_9ENTE|nr:hypothetical protein CBF29_01035 [Vagococcus elongatus]
MQKVISKPRVLFLVSILCTIPYYYLSLTDNNRYLFYIYGSLSKGVFYIDNLLIIIVSIIYYKKAKNISYMVPIFFSIILMLIPLLNNFLVLLEYLFLLM